MTVAHLELVGTAARLRTLNVRQERMTAEKYAWDLEWSTINSIESLNKNTHNPIFFLLTSFYNLLGKVVLFVVCSIFGC